MGAAHRALEDKRIGLGRRPINITYIFHVSYSLLRPVTGHKFFAVKR